MLSNEEFYSGNFYFVTLKTDLFFLIKKECNEFKGLLTRQLSKLKNFNESVPLLVSANRLTICLK